MSRGYITVWDSDLSIGNLVGCEDGNRGKNFSFEIDDTFGSLNALLANSSNFTQGANCGAIDPWAVNFTPAGRSARNISSIMSQAHIESTLNLLSKNKFLPLESDTPADDAFYAHVLAASAHTLAASVQPQIVAEEKEVTEPEADPSIP